jgi:hypothetical protein
MGNTCSSDKSTETKDGSTKPEDKPAADTHNGEQDHTEGDDGVTGEDKPDGDAE